MPLLEAIGETLCGNCREWKNDVTCDGIIAWIPTKCRGLKCWFNHLCPGCLELRNSWDDEHQRWLSAEPSRWRRTRHRAWLAAHPEPAFSFIRGGWHYCPTTGT